MPEHLARALESAPPEFRRIERAGRITLIAIIAVAVLLSLPVGDGWSDWANALLVLLGSAYLVTFLVLGDAAEKSTSRLLVAGYFALQLLLAAAIFAVPAIHGSFGMTWLAVMPLVAHAVFLLGRLGTATVSLLSIGLVVAHAAVVAPGPVVMQAGLGVVVSTAFVLLFTNIARIELRARTRSEELRDELGEANRRLAEYSVQAAELAASRERNRMAREIHDSLGHCLTVVSVQLEAAELVLGRDPDDGRTRIRRARDLARDGLQEVRRSVGALRTSPLDGRPLPMAVEALVAAEPEDGGVAVTFRTLGEPRELPDGAALTLYRGVQEALTNVRRHARAGNAQVTLDYRDPAVTRLVVSDDGVGTPDGDDSDRPDGAGGFGLMGLRERVQALSGRLEVRSRPGDGFTLEVEVPA